MATTLLSDTLQIWPTGNPEALKPCHRFTGNEKKTEESIDLCRGQRSDWFGGRREATTGQTATSYNHDSSKSIYAVAAACAEQRGQRLHDPSDVQPRNDTKSMSAGTQLQIYAAPLGQMFPLPCRLSSDNTRPSIHKGCFMLFQGRRSVVGIHRHQETPVSKLFHSIIRAFAQYKSHLGSWNRLV